METINNINEFIIKMEKLIIPKSSIGIHGISFKNNDVSIVDLVSSIMINGLYNNSKGGLVSNCIMCGTYDDCNYRKLYNYCYNDINNKFINIIVAIPETLEASNNDIYFIGNYNAVDIRKNKSLGNEKYNSKINTMWFNNYIEYKKILPKEFIVGAMLYDANNDKTVFITNPSYLGIISDNKRYKFVDELMIDVKKTLPANTIIYKFNDNDIKDIYKKIMLNISLNEKFKKELYYLIQAKEYIENNYKLDNKNKK